MWGSAPLSLCLFKGQLYLLLSWGQSCYQFFIFPVEKSFPSQRKITRYFKDLFVFAALCISGGTFLGHSRRRLHCRNQHLLFLYRYLALKGRKRMQICVEWAISHHIFINGTFAKNFLTRELCGLYMDPDLCITHNKVNLWTNEVCLINSCIYFPWFYDVWDVMQTNIRFACFILLHLI